MRSAHTDMTGATYGSLLNDDAPDVEFLNIDVLRVSVGLSVPEEAGDELDALLGPATFSDWEQILGKRMSECLIPGHTPCVALNCFAWEARPTPPLKRLNGMTCLCSATSPR